MDLNYNAQLFEDEVSIFTLRDVSAAQVKKSLYFFSFR